MSAADRSARRAALGVELDRLAVTATRSIRSKLRRDAWSRGIDGALPFAVVVPLLWLLGVGMGWLEGVPRGWVLLATSALPLAWLAGRILRAQFASVGERDALAVLDHACDLEDRLLSAREFLDAELDSPFVEAALEDAAAVVERARAAEPRLRSEPWSPDGNTWGIATVSVALLLWVFLFGPSSTVGEARSTGTSTGREELALLDTGPEATQPVQPPGREEVAREKAETAGVLPTASPASAERRDASGSLSDHTKESAGKTGEGRSSAAESSSSASESRGQPSNQSQASKAPDKEIQKPTANKKPKQPSDTVETPKKNDEDDSGSTAGRGSSKGSSKNPVVSKWSSKDQVTHQDDQEIEDDEETEDEEEDQESRGGVQPNLRDRKPPVSRDLRIGFGNNKDPDANGRGGPSESKKSRGTASLVLGVPIPDRVKGQPSPGKTKITQERIEPKAEQTPLLEAATRTPRSAPTGFIEQHDLSPWMRTLVRQYFLTLRNERERS
jgi:hypothetical protein